ncbi:MAG: helix-turn-helix transcriptional regulator [Clostridia bacterium]|nr:helix-turn-helix transcriptional regulator [Clostridia bacterium]
MKNKYLIAEAMKNFRRYFNPEDLQLYESGYAEVDDSWHKFVAIFPYYRIYLITEGDAVLYLKDSEQVLKSGRLYLIPPFQVVSSKCNNVLKHYYIHFSPKNNIIGFVELYKPIYEIQATATDEILCSELVACYEKNDVSSILKKNGIFRYLLSKFYENASFYDFEMLRFESVLEYIHDHIGEKIEVKTLAMSAGLSEVYFSNLFTKVFGLSPVKYINSKKMSLAATMLAKGNTHIKEIIRDLGFEHEAYFFRLFKKTFGCTPSMYKKLLITAEKTTV